MLKISLSLALSFALSITALVSWTGPGFASNSIPQDDQDSLLRIAAPLQDDAFSAAFGSNETSLGSGIAVSSGDSGGPVYDYQNGGYAAVGIISGAFTPMKSCSIAGETCYSDVVFSSVYRDLNALNMEITK